MTIHRIDDREIDLEILWYDGWKSWKMYDGPGQRRLSGRTTLAHVRGQVLSETPAVTKGKWRVWIPSEMGEHPFPDVGDARS
jgi:hypothetical protein